MLLNGPYTVNSGKVTTITGLSTSPDTSAIVVLNNSPYLVNGTIPGGIGHMPVDAFFSDAFLVPSGFNGSLQFTPTNYLASSVVSGSPSSVIFIITFADSEPLTQALKKGLPTGYPQPIPRLFNVGNNVNTVLGIASAVQNDGSVAGTSIIESTVSGDAGSAVSLTNDASLILGDNAHPARATIVGSGGNITILATGELDVANRIGANLINALAGNDFVVGVPTGHNFFWQINGVNFMEYGTAGLSMNIPTATIFDFLINAVDQLQISTTGFKFMQNAMMKMVTSAGGAIFDASSGTDLTLNAPNAGGGHVLNLQVGGTTFLHGDGTSTFFTSGQIARVNYGSTSIVTTGTSISHGLGATPDSVLLTPNISTNVWADTVGASTFTAHCGANCVVNWLALKKT